MAPSHALEGVLFCAASRGAAVGTPGDTATSPWLTLLGRESHGTLGRWWGDSTSARGASWSREDEPPVWPMRQLSGPRGALVRVGVQGRAGRSGASAPCPVGSRPASSAWWVASAEPTSQRYTASRQNPDGSRRGRVGSVSRGVVVSSGDGQVQAPGQPRLSRGDQLGAQLRGALVSCPGHSLSPALWGPPAPGSHHPGLTGPSQHPPSPALTPPLPQGCWSLPLFACGGLGCGRPRCLLPRLWRGPAPSSLIFSL